MKHTTYQRLTLQERVIIQALWGQPNYTKTRIALQPNTC